jgi:hypothetical protein
VLAIEPKLKERILIVERSLAHNTSSHFKEASSIKLNALIQIAVTNHSKLRTISIETNKLEIFLNKCKQENVKFNSFLNTIFSLALKWLYVHLNSVYKNEPIVYSIAVGFRKDLNYSVTDKNNINRYNNHLTLGFLSNFTLLSIDFANTNMSELLTDLDLERTKSENNQLVRNEFWKLTKIVDKNFNTIIERGDHK